jgi:phosphoribosylformimino-5-aminoimidazole carboxamide ribotide isomerase
MEVIPAIDLRGGRCVRLFQGDYARETVFSDDPVAMAKRWAEQGAPRLHIVDLDGARDGTQANAEATRAIIHAVELPVQVAGGVRDMATVDRWIEADADRVVLGTAAVQDPNFAAEACARYGDRIVVSLDGRNGYFASRGWLDQTEQRIDDLMRKFVELGIQRFVYTDIGVDGTLTAPNYDAIEELLKATSAKLISAGGVAETEHLVRLAELGVEGAIVGMALYEGRVKLPEALAAVAATR